LTFVDTAVHCRYRHVVTRNQVLITNGNVTHPEGFRKTEKVRVMHGTDRNLAGDTAIYIFYFLLTVNIFLFT